jgi:catechol 2,3-dioxygenase-like lactoylglutathione lyase family enzyme
MFTHIHFQTVPVADIDRALTFYTDRLGFEIARNEAYGDSRWVFLRLPGARTMLHFEKVDVVTTPPTPVLVLVANDVDDACAALTGQEVKIVSGPEAAPWNPSERWAMIVDSEGNRVLIQSIGDSNG